MEISNKAITLAEILTPDEIEMIDRMWHESKLDRSARATMQFHKDVIDLLTPVMPRINDRLNQENDPRYIAYMIEAALMATEEH